MKKFYFIALSFLLIASCKQTGFSQETAFRKHINYLASDELKGRLAASKEDSLAGRYIRETLLSYGYKPAINNGVQHFSYTFIQKRDAKIVRDTAFSLNIVMILEGSDLKMKQECLVIGAHYDHLGLGGPGSGSRRPDTLAIHYGADDNASGVAMMLELAKSLADEKPKRSVVIVAFGAEEQGIIGSKYFVEHLPKNMPKPVVMVNLDMVGRLNEKRNLEINGTGTFTDAEKLLKSIPNPDLLNFTMIPGGFGPSDHTSFYANGIPVLFFTTGVHYDYHTPEDRPDKINYPGMKQVFNYVLHVAEALADAPAAPVYQKAGSEKSTKAPALKVTLGLIPDFNGAYEGDGMRADFVTAGKPADKAGMKNGDIILQIGDRTIHNIQDYMDCLSTLKPGEKVRVKIKRGDKIEVLTINL